MIGQRLSRYRLLEQLGSGGMGVVHRAEDLQLGREVAIKLLPPELGGRQDALERFEREARLTSGLNDPHICVVHDVGRHDGRPFIVMELLEGESLRETLDAGPLPADRLVVLAMQIAQGLDAAHRRGVIHRDLKPANIFVGRGDQVKILDFGVAKLLSDVAPPGDPDASTTDSPPAEATTREWSDAGTPSYMSPEQARGEPVDARADLFSLGAVLYEMAAGARAFPGTTPAVVFDGVLNRPPDTAALRRRKIPDGLVRVIDKALEKDPDLRYQDAADLLADLRRLEREWRTRRPQPAGWASSLLAAGRAALADARVAGPVVLAAAAVVGWMLWSAPRATAPRDSILLAEIENRTDDPVFDGTIQRALAVQLSQSPFLEIVPDERIRETLALMGRPREERLAASVALEACERQGVAAMLGGSIARLGTAYVVSLEATDCASGDVIAREQAQVGAKEDVLRVVGRMASSIRARLGESLASLERFDVPVEQATTPSLDALRAYTLGTARRAAGAEIESIPFFQRAIELDPDFADAYSMLSSVYGNLGETGRSEEYARLAYSRRGHVSERERLFITNQYHDRITGDQMQVIETLELWKESFPRDYRPANALALTLIRLGQYERAADEAREAVRRNPAHPFPYSNLAHALRGAGRYDEAKAAGLEAVARGVETLPTRRLLYQIAVMQQDDAAAAGHLAWGRDRSREFDLAGARAQVLAFEGRLREFRELHAETVAMAGRHGFPEVASGYAAQAAWTEVLYGEVAAAATQARAVLAGDPGTAPRLRAATVLALAGHTGDAHAVVQAMEGRYRTDTFVNGVYLPVARAALALGSDANVAVEHLQAAAPYETGLVAALAPAYLRGLAHLRLERTEEAAAEFRKILDNRGVDPFSPLYAPAQLGLARALAAAGRIESSRRAYDALFSLWQEADPDLPLLIAARAEFAALAQRAQGPEPAR